MLSSSLNNILLFQDSQFSLMAQRRLNLLRSEFHTEVLSLTQKYEARVIFETVYEKSGIYQKKYPVASVMEVQSTAEHFWHNRTFLFSHS